MMRREVAEGRSPAVRALFRMPAEWSGHRATWIAWPHNEADWPSKFEAIPWVYAEIVRVLHRHEIVEILCNDDAAAEDARSRLQAHGCSADGYRLHVVPTDRSWLRDTAPTAVHDNAGNVVLLNWSFNGWAKYENYLRDARVGRAVAAITGFPLQEPERPDGGGRLVLEGGAFDVNGAGCVLVTEECLLSDEQVRNPGMSRSDYERVFARWLGCERTIWLGEGCVGDDTHGHVDDVARFVAPDTVLLAYEPDPADENHRRSADNLRRLELALAGWGRVVLLPFPRPVVMEGQRLPASYANFYIANGSVLVPTFNDPADRRALEVLAECFPDREVVGIHSVDLVWGLGTLHCLTQQEPLPAPRGGSDGQSSPMRHI
jgi:agmatine deiminase